MHPFLQTDARSGQSDRGHHFLHTNVILRHACGTSGEAEEHIDTILTRAAVLKRRVWVSSMLFAELRPSMFVPGRFGAFQALTRYIRSLVTLVTPDPNTMLRVARLRDAKWQRPAHVRGADEKPRTMSFTDAVQIASALWVKEAGGVADLKFLMFDEAKGRPASLAPAPSGLRDGWACQFGRPGGGAIDPHSALSSGPLDPTISASRTRIRRNLQSLTRIKQSRRPRPLISARVWSTTGQPPPNTVCQPFIARTPARRSYPPASGGSQGRTAPRARARSRPWRHPCRL